MSEKKNRLKELLEWLHHGYWIREFLLSSGIWSSVVLLISRYITPIGPRFMWPLLLTLVGTSMYLLDLWQKNRSPSTPQAQSSTALLTDNNTEALSPGVNIDEFYRMAFRSVAMETEVHKNMRILARQKSPNNLEAFI